MKFVQINRLLPLNIYEHWSCLETSYWEINKKICKISGLALKHPTGSKKPSWLMVGHEHSTQEGLGVDVLSECVPSGLPCLGVGRMVCRTSGMIWNKQTEEAVDRTSCFGLNSRSDGVLAAYSHDSNKVHPPATPGFFLYRTIQTTRSWPGFKVIQITSFVQKLWSLCKSCLLWGDGSNHCPTLSTKYIFLIFLI